jgi:hypothetical protein
MAQSVEEWLNQIGLPEYKDSFIQQGFDDIFG